MASRKDYYDILGVRRGATEEEIEKAYQRLARAYQSAPLPGSKISEFRFREILEAYEVLSDRSKRERYDRMGMDFPLQEFFWDPGQEETEEEQEGSWEGFEDVIAQNSRVGDQTPSPFVGRAKDLYCTLDLDFESALSGTVKEVEVREEVPCESCSGKGLDPEGPKRLCLQCGGAGQVQVGLPPSTFSSLCRQCQGVGKVLVRPCRTCSGRGWVHQKRSIWLRIPPGADDGCRIYLMGMGPRGKNGRANGDLIAEVRVEKHPYFQRKGEDLYIEVPITVWEAILGTEVEVPTLKGSRKVKVAPGLQPGDQYRLPGQGFPSFDGASRGDQVIVFRVVIPGQVDEGLKKILRELKGRNSENPRQRWGWFLKSWRSKKPGPSGLA